MFMYSKLSTRIPIQSETIICIQVKQETLSSFRKEIRNIPQSFYFHFSYSKFLQNITIGNKIFYYCIIKGVKNLYPAILAYFNIYEVLNVKIKDVSTNQMQYIQLYKLLVNTKTNWIINTTNIILDNATSAKLSHLILSKAQSKGCIILINKPSELINEEMAKAMNINIVKIDI